MTNKKQKNTRARTRARGRAYKHIQPRLSNKSSNVNCTVIWSLYIPLAKPNVTIVIFFKKQPISCESICFLIHFRSLSAIFRQFYTIGHIRKSVILICGLLCPYRKILGPICKFSGFLCGILEFLFTFALSLPTPCHLSGS